MTSPGIRNPYLQVGSGSTRTPTIGKPLNLGGTQLALQIRSQKGWGSKGGR